MLAAEGSLIQAKENIEGFLEEVSELITQR